MSNVRAVEDYVVINGVLTPRWFPQVPGFPGEFVVPQAWVKSNCPNGFKLPNEALHAAEKFLFG